MTDSAFPTRTSTCKTSYHSTKYKETLGQMILKLTHEQVDREAGGKDGWETLESKESTGPGWADREIRQDNF